jgi:hypothetical protein
MGRVRVEKGVGRIGGIGHVGRVEQCRNYENRSPRRELRSVTVERRLRTALEPLADDKSPIWNYA